jgi:hypothetical protein
MPMSYMLGFSKHIYLAFCSLGFFWFVLFYFCFVIILGFGYVRRCVIINYCIILGALSFLDLYLLHSTHVISGPYNVGFDRI